jgi:N-acetylglutamate synthase-like GNAT family acetyltransferase
MNEPLILEALPSDRMDSLVTALREASLPHLDISFGEKRFFCASIESQTVGYVGLEISGSEALLRSAVVFLSARGRGYGREMVRQLIEVSGSLGVQRLWLLTVEASGFFAKQGFRVVDRLTVPQAIAEFKEFRELCSAVCMMRELGRGGD